MHKLMIAIASAVLLFGCVTETNRYTFDELDARMGADIYQCEDQRVSMCYRYMLPNNSHTVKPPMIVFLHGAGGNGYDNKLSIRDSGFGNLSYFADKTAQSIIVVPQCPYGMWWPTNTMVEVLAEFIPHCVSKFGADKNRVYVTGYSMGGIGTWKLIESYPELFAAAVPVCGGPLASWDYEEPDVSPFMKDLNIWAFNSVNDTVIQNIYSKNAMSNLWDEDSTKAHYTESFNGHTDNWVYSNADFMTWLFSQTKSE